MARFLPLLLPRTAGEWCPAHPATRFPSERPRFLHGDPRELVPRTCKQLANQGDALLPWGTGDGDLLLAPAPRPGEEAELQCQVLRTLPENFSVLLYPRESPFLNNLRFESESLCLLPAGRLAHLLRGSAWAERRPGPRGSLQTRVFLGLALDLWRSLMLLEHEAEHSRLVGEARLPHELDFLPQARGAELLALARLDGAAARRARGELFEGEIPQRVHLPWWAGRSWPAWQINRICARHWPREWQQVEVQVQLGSRFRRLPAQRYFRAFRSSGSTRRLLWGRRELGAE
jgi:hypothetical protein